MYKHRISTTLVYFFVGLGWLLLGSFLIKFIDSRIPETDLRFLYHYKNVIFLFITCIALYFLLEAHHKHILRVEDNYHKLFEGSPGAAYVMDRHNFKFLEVNGLMVKQYGYTREELFQMTALDIRTEKERSRLADYLNSEHIEGHETGVWLHQRKNGEQFYVLISHHAIQFQNKDAYIVIVIDVDKSVRNEKRMNEIMWSNSHEIRRPASNILGLIDLIKKADPNLPVDNQLIELLAASANELDDIIHKINAEDTDLPKNYFPEQSSNLI